MNEETQVPVDNELSVEDAKASLGLATRLSEGHLMAMNPMAEEEAGQEGLPEAQNAPDSEVEPEVEETPMEEEKFDLEPLKADLSRELSETVRVSVREEVGNLRKDIEKALSDEDEKAKTK